MGDKFHVSEERDRQKRYAEESVTNGFGENGRGERERIVSDFISAFESHFRWRQMFRRGCDDKRTRTHARNTVEIWDTRMFSFFNLRAIAPMPSNRAKMNRNILM